MDGFSNLFAAPPSYLAGLLGEDETERLRKEAQQSGLMNLGLSLLAGAGPSPQRQGLGQLLAQGVMAGQQASRNAYEQAVRDRMMQEQIAEQRQAREERQRALMEQRMAEAALPAVIRRPATEMYGEDIMGQRVGEGVSYGAPSIDLGRLLSLPIGVQQRIMPQVGAAAKLIPELRKAQLIGQQTAQENPFATFTQDATAPANVRALAKQYEKSFAAGQLDPDKVDDRIKQLAEMTQRIEQFNVTQQGLAENRRSAEIARQLAAQNTAALVDIRRAALEEKIAQAREKTEEKEETKTKAKEQLTTTVEQLKKNYDKLLQEGGIVSTQQGSVSNLGASLSSSRLGRAVGGAVGTKTQEQRQSIEQTRPLLLNLIKNATGMSAQQMNSNAEMQLYLNAATNPSLSYEANMEALANLDRLFGLGSAAKTIEDQLKKDQGKGGQTRSGW